MPIVTKPSSPRAQLHRRGVWVPAFAGTKLRKLKPRALRSLSRSPVVDPVRRVGKGALRAVPTTSVQTKMVGTLALCPPSAIYENSWRERAIWCVVPAKAGTHNHRCQLLQSRLAPELNCIAAAYGSLLSQGRHWKN